MASSPYMPNEDAQFSIWAQAFANGISDDPARFMLSPAQAASIQTVVDAFVAALLVASTESTRTKPAIISKDNARSVCESLCRQYAMLIKQNDGIADEDKVSIGVRPENPTRTPIDCPQSVPLLNIVAATPGAQTVRFADSVDPENRAKPFGASEILLFCAITDGPNPAPFTDAKFVGK